MGRRIEFPISMFSGLVLLLSLLVSPSCLLITSLHLSFTLPIHVLITTSSSLILSTWPNHRRLASLIFSLMFTTKNMISALGVGLHVLVFSMHIVIVAFVLELRNS